MGLPDMQADHAIIDNSRMDILNYEVTELYSTMAVLEITVPREDYDAWQEGK